MRDDLAAQVRAQVSMPELLEQLGIETPSGLEGKIPCVFHEDQTPSLHIYEDHWYAYCCGMGGSVIDFVMRYFGCSFHRAVAYLSTGIDDMAPAPAAKARVEDVDLTDRFTSEPIGLHLLEEADEWVRRTWPYLSGLADLDPHGVKVTGHSIWIPHYDPEGRVRGVKIRSVPSGSKLSMKGSRYRHPYMGIRVMPTEFVGIIICEGESDTWCMDKYLHDSGTPMVAMGLPSGAGSWRKEWADSWTGLDVFVALDDDDAGNKAAARIAADLNIKGVRHYRLTPPGGRVAEAFAGGWEPEFSVYSV